MFQGTVLHKDLLSRCNHNRPEKLTSDLMSAVWSRTYMATHTLTGNRGSKVSLLGEKSSVDIGVLLEIEGTPVCC